MQRVFSTIALVLATLSAPSSGADGIAEESALEAEARELAGEFVGRLKPELQRAMQSGGPVNAVSVCADRAPRIADALSHETGWLVKRVSLKARNASRAIPDTWEVAVLQQFEERQLAGEAPAGMHYGELTPSHYRYMQAQGVEGVCLVCHGETLSAEVREALETYYPDDRATGYTPGQVRGAISLSKKR